MVRGCGDIQEWEDDYPFWNTQIFAERSFPAMFFIEKSYSNDPTNWWIPNRAAVEAMLRSSGLAIEARPEPETWICSPASVIRGDRYLLDHELEGTL
jgi:tRNA (mo5U34)-methyltransferase